jgi:uncharacterized protein YcgL (UPF0745 family)
MSTLSPFAQAALDRIGSRDDLQLRTTLRRDDCHVWTSADLLSDRYFTLAKIPDDLREAFGWDDEVVTRSLVDAEAAHEAMVARVQRMLDAQPQYWRWCEACRDMTNHRNAEACTKCAAGVSA